MTIVGYEAAGGEIKSRTYYLEDNWDDNALSSRSNPTSGPWFYQPVPNQPGDTLVGRYRPDWTIPSGTPSATNQRVEFPDSNANGIQEIVTDTDITVGSWQWDFTSAANVDAGSGSGLVFIWQDSNNKWFTPAQGDDEVALRKTDAGTTTTIYKASATVDDGNPHTIEQQRDDAGNFETFVDGASIGTGSDTFLPTPNLMRYYSSNWEAKVYLDNLKVQ